MPTPGTTINDGIELSDKVIKKTLNPVDNKVTYTFQDASTETNNNLYFTPFRMQVYLSPIRTVKYIYDLTDDSTSLSYKNITNSSTLYMSPSTVSVKKGTGNNKYHLHLILTLTYKILGIILLLH